MATFTAKDKRRTTPLLSPTIRQTFQQAFRLPAFNVKPTVAILLLLAIPLTIFFISHSVIKPITYEVEPGSPEYYMLRPAINKDLTIFWGEEALLLLASTIVALVAGFATIYASHAACTGEKISIKELEIRVTKGWKQPLITSIYIQLFGLGLVFLVSVLITLVVILYKISTVLVAIFVLLIVLCGMLYLYLSAVWTLAIIVAAVEEGCYGLAAIGRAGWLMRGRKMQGLAIAFLFMVATAIILFPIGNPQTGEKVRLVLDCAMVNLVCIISFFRWVVFTVFYFGCKMNHGEEVNGSDLFGYSLVLSNAHVAPVVP